jgi:hypothetical protein
MFPVEEKEEELIEGTIERYHPPLLRTGIYPASGQVIVGRK